MSLCSRIMNSHAMKYVACGVGELASVGLYGTANYLWHTAVSKSKTFGIQCLPYLPIDSNCSSMDNHRIYWTLGGAAVVGVAGLGAVLVCSAVERLKTAAAAQQVEANDQEIEDLISDVTVLSERKSSEGGTASKLASMASLAGFVFNLHLIVAAEIKAAEWGRAIAQNASPVTIAALENKTFWLITSSDILAGTVTLVWVASSIGAFLKK